MSIVWLLRSALILYRRSPIRFTVIAALAVPIHLLDFRAAASPFWWPYSLLAMLLTELVFAALIAAVATAASGATPDIRVSLEQAARRAGSILGYLVRYWGAIVLLAVTIVGIPLAIRLLIRWHFGTYGVMLRSLAPVEAIGLSSRVVESMWWKMFAITVMPTALIGAAAWAPILIAGSYSFQVGVISLSLAAILLPLRESLLVLVFLERVQQLEEREAVDGLTASRLPS